jgi:hypothetical protein
MDKDNICSKNKDLLSEECDSQRFNDENQKVVVD